MAMNERIARLRQQSLEAIPTISTERAELMTEFYRQHTEPRSAPVRRALAFQYLMEHKTICINAGELIVGEKGPAPKATPTYPELCCHSLQDLDILDSREKISFAAIAEVFADGIRVPPGVAHLVDFQLGHKATERQPEVVAHQDQALYAPAVTLPQCLDQQTPVVFTSPV